VPGIDPLITTLVAAWLLGFGAAAARSAKAQRRRPWTWAVFGAILGPAALALIRLAPPGRCWSCSAPTQGWLTRCVWCGEDVREPQEEPPTEDPVVRGPLTVIEGSAPASPSRAANARAGRAARAPGGVGSDSRPSAPGPVDRGRIELPRRHAQPLAADADVPAEPASAVVAAASEPVRSLRSRVPRTGQAAAAAAVAPEIEVRNVVLASAIFMTGSRALPAGSRFGISLVGDDLHILGPVDVDPSAVVLVHSLRGMDATANQGRLVITARQRRRDRLVLVFMAVAGGSPEGVADAIVAAASRLGPVGR
jgi:hypothetical protein